MFRCICFIDTIEVKKVGRIENQFSFFIILFGKHPKPLHTCIYRYPAVGTLVSFEYGFAVPFVEIGFLELPSLQACGVAFAIFIENFLPNFRRFCLVVFLDRKLLKGFCPHIKDFIIVIGIVAPVPSRSKKSPYICAAYPSQHLQTRMKNCCVKRVIQEFTAMTFRPLTYLVDIFLTVIFIVNICSLAGSE